MSAEKGKIGFQYPDPNEVDTTMIDTVDLPGTPAGDEPERPTFSVKRRAAPATRHGRPNLQAALGNEGTSERKSLRAPSPKETRLGIPGIGKQVGTTVSDINAQIRDGLMNTPSSELGPKSLEQKAILLDKKAEELAKQEERLRWREEDLDTEADRIKEELHLISEEKQAVRELRQQLEGELAEKERAALEELERLLEEKKAELAGLEKEIAGLDEELAVKNDSIVLAKKNILEGLERSIQAEKKKLDELKAIPAKIKAAFDFLKNWEEGIAKKEKELNQKFGLVDELREDAAQKRQKAEKLIKELARQAASMDAKLDANQREMEARQMSIFMKREELKEGWNELKQGWDEVMKNKRVVWASVMAVVALTLGSGCTIAGFSYYASEKFAELEKKEDELKKLERELAERIIAERQKKNKKIDAVADKTSPSAKKEASERPSETEKPVEKPAEEEVALDIETIEPNTDFELKDIRGVYDDMPGKWTCSKIKNRDRRKINEMLEDGNLKGVFMKLVEKCNNGQPSDSGYYHTFPEGFTINVELIDSLAKIIDSGSKGKIERLFIFHRDDDRDNFYNGDINKVIADSEGKTKILKDFEVTGGLSDDIQALIKVLAQNREDADALAFAGVVAYQEEASYREYVAITKGAEKDPVSEEIYQRFFEVLKDKPDLIIDN